MTKTKQILDAISSKEPSARKIVRGWIEKYERTKSPIYAYKVEQATGYAPVDDPLYEGFRYYKTLDRSKLEDELELINEVIH